MQIITATMSANEARAALDQIERHLDQVRHHVTEMRQLAYDLKERQGWKALGYTSLAACLHDRFGNIGTAHIYRLIDAAQTEQNLLGEITGQIPERQLRTLVKYDAETQRALYQIAQRTAPDGKVTASHIEAVSAVVVGLVTEGGLDDGTGETKPLGVLLTARITEEAYERLQRQQQIMRDRQTTKHGAVLVSTDVALGAASDDRITLYADAATVQTIAQLRASGKPTHAYLVIREQSEKE